MSAQAALCHLCCRPFGRLEGTRAPYVIACGHVLCVECSSEAKGLCPICATAINENSYHRFLVLVHQPVDSDRLRDVSIGVDDDPHVASRLLDAISRVDDLTTTPHIRRLHHTAYAFLQGRPRNCHKDLETNVRLLGCILQAKETIHLQSEITNELTSKIEELHSENDHLRRQLDEVRRLYDEEKECVREIQVHISDYMRTHPEIDLMMDEIIAFRNEINELRAALAVLGSSDTSAHSTPSTPSLTDMEESDPPSATVLAMPFTPDETTMDTSQLLASPLFIPALPDIGREHEDNCLDIDSDLDLERLRPDLYTKPTVQVPSREAQREAVISHLQPRLNEDPHRISFCSGAGGEGRRRTGYVSTEGQGALALHFQGGQSGSPRVGTLRPDDNRGSDNNASMASSYTTASDGIDERTPAGEGFRKRECPIVLVTTTPSPLSVSREGDLTDAHPPRSYSARDTLQVHFKHEPDLVVDYGSGSYASGELPPEVEEEGDAATEAEADRFMSLSTSSITLLRTPHNEMLNDTEDPQIRLHDLLHGVGSHTPAPPFSGALGLPLPSLLHGDNLNSMPPSLLSSTGTRVSHRDDMPTVRATRRRTHPRMDASQISQHVVDEMRKALIEVVSRIFMQLVSDDTPLPSSSSLSAALVMDEGTHTDDTQHADLFCALNEEISPQLGDSAVRYEEEGRESDGGHAT